MGIYTIFCRGENLQWSLFGLLCFSSEGVLGTRDTPPGFSSLREDKGESGGTLRVVIRVSGLMQGVLRREIQGQGKRIHE